MTSPKDDTPAAPPKPPVPEPAPRRKLVRFDFLPSVIAQEIANAIGELADERSIVGRRDERLNLVPFLAAGAPPLALQNV